MTFYSNKPQGRLYTGPEGTQKTVTGLNGSIVEDQYASDRNAIVYVADEKSKRYVTFKAFLKSFKFNVKPKINLNESLYLINPFVSSGQTLFSYKISLEVPSFNSDEGFSNLAKMQELFRYISTLNTAENFVTNGFVDFDKARRSTIYFSNLINLGKAVVFPSDDVNPIDLILENGISGVIKSIEFKPSLEDGFHESATMVFTDVEGSSRELNSTNGFAAKKYDLDLELFMSTPQGEVGSAWPFGMKFVNRPSESGVKVSGNPADTSETTGVGGINQENGMNPDAASHGHGDSTYTITGGDDEGMTDWNGDGPPPDE